MRGKKTSSQVFAEIDKDLKGEESPPDLEKLAIKISLKDMTLEERIQEASKPLYLKRYE